MFKIKKSSELAATNFRARKMKNLQYKNSTIFVNNNDFFGGSNEL